MDVPEALRRRYPDHSWLPVTWGVARAGVWRLDGAPPLFVKIATHSAHRDSGFHLGAEAQRLAWFATMGVPAPEIIDAGRDDRNEWLITRAAPGRTAADPWPEARRTAVVDALADAALAMHALPVAGCPFDRSLAVTVPDALHAANAGLIDLADLDAERRDWSRQRLVDTLLATRPRTEDLVVCHGDFCLPNVLLDPVSLRLTGLVDVGRAGLADRYQDLALITRSLSTEINSQYGMRYAERFLQRYAALSTVGDDGIDRGRIAFYRLLDEFF
jgi:kanamycin kinase